MVRKILVWTLIIGAAVIALVTVALYTEWSQGRALSDTRWQFYLDVYKAVGVGFLVALLGSVIPHVLPEARDQFERFKESRTAYSEAKTGVMYLPERLAGTRFPEAVESLAAAHKSLHLAETYLSELQSHLSSWHPYPETWVDRNYWDLMAMRKFLDVNADQWSTFSHIERLTLLNSALAIVEDVFGPEGKRWAKALQEDNKKQLESALAEKLDEAR
jgi:hypothetical protein